MTEALKPCPFCGGEAEFSTYMTDGGQRENVRCDDCNAGLGGWKKPGCAVDHWNRRADLPAAVTVKPLKVEERRNHRLGLGPYEIAPNGPDIDGNQYWRARLHGKVICKKIKGVGRAIEWVQRHHREYILSHLATQPDPVGETARVPAAAVEALAAYRQADQEGVMVLVSRQAIDECLPALRALAEQEQSE